MSEIILMTVHGVSSDATNSDGSMRHSVADTTGLTERLGYRPIFCTRLYPDNLMQSWFAVFASAPRYVEVVDIFKIDDSEVIPIDSWYWTQYCLHGGLDQDSWNEVKELAFNVSSLEPWQQEYLVKSIPDNSYKIHVESLTNDCDSFFPKFIHEVMKAPKSVCDTLADSLYYLKEDTINYVISSRQSLGFSSNLTSIPIEVWYSAFVETTGLFTFLWAIVCHQPVMGWCLGLSMEVMAPLLENAFALRHAWDKSGGSCGNGGFSRVDLNYMRQCFYSALDRGANHCMTEWKQHSYSNVGRNNLCPCGSGRKFKKCHGGSYGFAWLCDNPFVLD